MKGQTAIYLGQVIQKEHFRAYVYSPDGAQHLVESWHEFEKKMESGVWFATIDDAKANIPVIEEKPKRVRKSIEEPQITEKKSIEEPKINDDFLPINKD